MECQMGSVMICCLREQQKMSWLLNMFMCAMPSWIPSWTRIRLIWRTAVCSLPLSHVMNVLSSSSKEVYKKLFSCQINTMTLNRQRALGSCLNCLGLHSEHSHWNTAWLSMTLIQFIAAWVRSPSELYLVKLQEDEDSSKKLLVPFILKLHITF